ncbi:uncharacterized protein LOC123296007 [Chrysoperla carnea]|uniref:uncharacterized protein LOC123296007 n=1 Tax=Chrysoperla carnea TaxID=189513 RepID=UPI001D09279F|nr:uncharacterized protein LOC123296007 [Chrysoperla carnea]
MESWLRTMITVLILVVISTISEAFFLNWGTTETVAKPQWPVSPSHYYYHQQRFLQPQASNIQAQYINPSSASNNNDLSASSVSSHYPQQTPLLMAQQQQQQPPSQSQSIPAIPIQVPLQAQLTPQPNLQNVQLVPCLCPISQDDIEKASEIYSVKNNQ